MPAWRNRITSDSSDDQPQPAESSESARRRGTSIISLGTAISGTLRSEDPLYIEGEFDGEIIASSDVTVARGSNVNARVQAIRLTVAGKLTGTVACTDRFEVLDTGEVKAEVLSPVFVVHEGAVINGSLRMRLDDDDDESTLLDVDSEQDQDL
ncbi:MAG: polymer-forming cytoskeletal protein [Thermomicrobiales bacterium]